MTSARGGVGSSASSIPAYLQGLSDYQVVRLTSATEHDTVSAAVLNDTSYTASTPANNGSNTESITDAWGGGAADNGGHRLFLHGGGHDDGCFNGIVQIDAKGGSVANGCSIVPNSHSPVAQVPTSTANHSTYNDGKPGSIHSYGCLAYEEASDQFLRVGGALYRSGGFTTDVWTNVISTGAWTSRTALSTGPSQNPLVVINQAERKAMFCGPNGGNFISVAFYDFTDNTWSSLSATTFGEGGDLSAVYDQNRDQVLVFGFASGELGRIHTIDWGAETFLEGSFTVTGTIVGDGGFTYDSGRSSLWHLNGTAGTIYELTSSSATAYTSTANSLGSDWFTLADGVGSGLFTRIACFADWRIVLAVANANEAPSAIKLPA